jgi:hypothetical protein
MTQSLQRSAKGVPRAACSSVPFFLLVSATDSAWSYGILHPVSLHLLPEQPSPARSIETVHGKQSPAQILQMLIENLMA